MKNLSFTAGAALLLAACATTPTADQVAAIVTTKTPNHFQATATVKNDSLDTTATISTEPGFQERRGLLGIVWDDNFLRAFVDKMTGETTIQVYQSIMYDGDWRYYRTVNYETPSGPVSRPVTSISRDVVTCSGGSGCTVSEHFAFEVDEALLRQIAARYVPGEISGWRFKYGAQRAEDWQDGMLPAEALGLLNALDRLRQDLNLPAANTP